MRKSVLNARRLLIAALAFVAGAAPASEQPRVVSLNPCLDTVLVEILPREQILALSQYSRDASRSNITSLAATLPHTYETAEEVVLLKPDLVIAGSRSSVPTQHALRRVGIRIEQFDVPRTVAASIEQIRRLAALVQRRDEGEALVARIEHAISKARPKPGTVPLTAVVYQPGGLSVGGETITGELMQIAGFDNLAARYGVGRYAPLSLELILHQPPDVLLLGDTAYGAPTRAAQLVQHRALRALEPHTRREPFPARLFYCAGPVMVDALAALVTAREHVGRPRNATRVSAHERPGQIRLR